MKRMLINATHTDEIRVAIADGQKLFDLDIDSAGHDRKKGNIYKARITRVEPSLEACFVNYGADRHGFLPYKEISPIYCKKPPKGVARLPINEAVKEGDELIIQVNKEERGNKGAALSTYISLAGRYLVYMPGNQRAGGISRQIRGEERKALQDKLNRLNIPNNDGVIIRTAGLGRAFEELEWDFTYLQQVWTAIQAAAEKKNAPFFIYQESDLFIRAIRDYLQPDIGEILIDDKKSYEKAREFMQQVMPHNLKKISYYDDNTPLFSRYQIERQIQSAFEREVKLPSGGSLVIDHTEALISIDINSAKATKGADVESTALHTNLESAEEIARQLRLRDLGGLVVIDFIDMRSSQNQRSVENKMRESVDIDRARVQIGKISKFGLLEMSRQRLRSSINDSSQITCPTCSGHGFIRSQESLVISIIRLTEEEMIKPYTGKVIIQAPTDIANAILNEKRNELSDLEQRHSVQLAVISNENLSAPNFHVQRYKTSESNINISDIELVKPEDCNKSVFETHTSSAVEKPLLETVVPDIQAPKRSFFAGITQWIKSKLGNSSSKSKPAQKSGHKNTRKKQHNPKHRNQQSHKKTPYSNNKQGHKKENNTTQKRNNNQRNAAKNNQQKSNRNQTPKKANNNPQTSKPANQNRANNKNQQRKKPVSGQPQNQKNKNNSPKSVKEPATNKKQQQQNKAKTNPTPVKKDHTSQGNTAPVRAQKPKQNQTHKTNDQMAAAEENKKNMMDRPLGSVADLVAKKTPIVPSGAKPKNVEKQANPQKPEAKQPRKKNESHPPEKSQPTQDNKSAKDNASAAQKTPAPKSKTESNNKSSKTNKPAQHNKQERENKPPTRRSTQKSGENKENKSVEEKKTTQNSKNEKNKSEKGGQSSKDGVEKNKQPSKEKANTSPSAKTEVKKSDDSTPAKD